MVKNVDNTIFEDFAPLIPAKFSQGVESGQYFCLGALKEDGDGHLPVGVLVFSVEDGLLDGGEQATMIVLHWFYVAEAYRKRGFANELMDALSDILDGSDAEGIICDVPFDGEYDLAEAFLVSWGFQFEVMDTNEMIITKEDCRKQGSSRHVSVDMSVVDAVGKPAGLASILEIPEEAFKKAVKRAKAEDPDGLFELISENREDYAGDISSVIMKNGEVSSIALFERFGDGDLHLIMFMCFSPDAAKEMLALLRYVVSYYYVNYPEESAVHLTLGTERGMNLAANLFPDNELVQVRRGFFS